MDRKFRKILSIVLSLALISGVCAVAVCLAVCLVVLFVIRDQVVERKAVVCGNKVY